MSKRDVMRNRRARPTDQALVSDGAGQAVSTLPGFDPSRVPATVKVVNGPTILLRSGEYFDFLTPEACSFRIEDIAHGLSNICRFAGHCREFYSVAQHSVYVSQLVPRALAFEALMHDAAEAFVGDVAKPLKVMLPEYKVIEERVESALFARYGLMLPMDPAIKEADVVMLATEQRDLMRNHDDWEYCRGRVPANFKIEPMNPPEAFAFFMERFDELATHRQPVTSALCEDCPPVAYPTDITRCTPCPRRSAAAQAIEARSGETASQARSGTDESAVGSPMRPNDGTGEPQ